MPYYYFQDEKLWPPIFWGVAFMTVNAIRVIAIALERRPVVLNDPEEELHRITFSPIDKREFLKLISLSRWVDCSSGEVVLKKGQAISEAIVVVAGHLEAFRNGNARMTLRPGQFIGDVSAYSGLASAADVVARGPVTLAKWDLEHLREFTATRAPRQPIANGERGSCRQIARYRRHWSWFSCGKTRSGVILDTARM